MQTHWCKWLHSLLKTGTGKILSIKIPPTVNSDHINTIRTACKLLCITLFIKNNIIIIIIYTMYIYIFFSFSISSQGYQLVLKQRRKKVSLTLTATHSPAQEAPPTRHPCVSTGKSPPSIPSSLPNHVLSHVITPFSVLPPTPVTCPKESWQKCSEENKDTNDCSRQAALASAFITSHFCHTQKLLMKPPSCAHDGLHSAVTLAFGAHGFYETVRGQ